MRTAFISGHLDLTEEEFSEHYVALIDEALKEGCSFVVGDARGADTMAQQYLKDKTNNVRVFHAYNAPRNNLGFSKSGGFHSQSAKDYAMTKFSNFDIAWVRPGREDSGTQRNLDRRKEIIKQANNK